MVSAVVLTKNEETNIKDCLKTLSWCGEIIVIDDNSTDKTREIAQKLGAKVFTNPLNNDFSAQRNYGLEKTVGPARNASHSDAGGEWVLFVDADERISSALAEEIQAQISIRQLADKSQIYEGYYIKRKDFLFSKWLKYGETANVRLLRLAKKGTGRWVRPVHETWQVKGKTYEFVNPLLHYPHQTIKEFLEDINFYTNLNAQVFYRDGVKTSCCQILAYPLAKFIKNYFLKLGFLDGIAGLLQTTFMSFHSFLTRAKLWLLWKKK